MFFLVFDLHMPSVRPSYEEHPGHVVGVRVVYMDACTHCIVLSYVYILFSCFFLFLACICPSHAPHAPHIPLIEGTVRGMLGASGACAECTRGVHRGMHECSCFFLFVHVFPCFLLFLTCVYPSHTPHAHHISLTYSSTPHIRMTHTMCGFARDV